MTGYFVYCEKTAGKEMTNMMLDKNYSLKKLDDDKKAFWNAMNLLKSGDTLVLFSHGDENGPLMVAGQEDTDMTEEEIKDLAKILNNNKCNFYCISCNTGKDGLFSKTLNAAKVSFIAPEGYAALETSSAGINLKVVLSETPYSTKYGKWISFSGGEKEVLRRTILKIPAM